MAYYNGKREPVEEVDTVIWTCTNEDCSGWMRDRFSFEETPACPLCKSEMVKETKTLPEIK